MPTQTLQPLKIQQRASWDRRFYLIMAVASEVVIFAGFSRSYYLKSYFPSHRPALSLLVSIHGFLFTAWMIYFIAQTALIALRRPSLHRTLGLLGAFLGSAVIVMGLLVAFTAMRLGHGSPTQDAEVIFLVALIDIGSFALFFILGYLKRKDREAHQRLMLLAVVVGLTGAGIGRLQSIGVPIPALSLINLALLFAGPIYDWITRRSVHPVYRWGIAFALLTFTPLRFAIGTSSWWHHAAHVIAATR